MPVIVTTWLMIGVFWTCWGYLNHSKHVHPQKDKVVIVKEIK